jgi:hypothetical protein
MGELSMQELLRTVPMPGRIRALPRNKVGYPIPFFAAEIDGVRDFRVGDPDAYRRCVIDRLCWVCGQRRPREENAFVVGPMCAVNRISQDPPCHRECAQYAAQVCPFMARPAMVRRHSGLPEDIGNVGIAIPRNPGACLVWDARTFQTFRPPVGGEFGVLFSFGDPTHWSWWACGRPATRAEVLASFESGLPLLEEQCDLDRDPAGARRALARQYERALTMLPKEVAVAHAPR